MVNLMDFKTFQNIPKNSWLCDAKASGERVIIAGENVEVSPNFVAEGAWAGDFSAAGVQTSVFRSGSGIIFDGSRILIFPPSHCVEVVYCFIFDDFDRVLVSNSLAFLNAYCDKSAFNKNLAGLVERNASKIHSAGMIDYKRILYKTSFGEMRLIAWSIHEINFFSKVVKEITPVESEIPFFDFTSYRNYLIDVLKATTSNAFSNLRSKPLRKLVSTVSAGYDSAACAALAKAVGCVDTVTLTTSRGGKIDSGAPVAAALGMKCNEYDRFIAKYEKFSDDRGFICSDLLNAPENDEFFSNIVQPNDIVFKPFSSDISNSVLFTGFHGDKVWAMGCPSGPDVIRGDASGFGMDEFRKRLSFVNVVVPFIGAKHYSLIAEISGNEEMKPYCLDYTIYSRPIPRRIVEEAGVSRKLFGQDKMAGAAHIRRPIEHFYSAFSAIVKVYKDGIRSYW